MDKKNIITRKNSISSCLSTLTSNEEETALAHMTRNNVKKEATFTQGCSPRLCRLELKSNN